MTINCNIFFYNLQLVIFVVIKDFKEPYRTYDNDDDDNNDDNNDFLILHGKLKEEN
jgi:hypothetical protein